MVKKNHKKGFSLAEALVSMLILSIFFGVAAKMVTQRPKQEYIVSPHGFFECYKDNTDGTIKVNGTGLDSPTTGTCEFTPAKNTSVYNLVLYSYGCVYYRILYEMNYKIRVTFEDSKFIITDIDNEQKEIITISDGVIHEGKIKDFYELINKDDFQTEVELVTPKAETKNQLENGPGIYISW